MKIACVLALATFMSGSQAVAASVQVQELDAGLVVQIFMFATLVAGFIAQWFREGRAQKWARDAAKLIADQATAAAEAVALKAANEVLAQAAEGNKTAAALAAKVLTDAKDVADKVLAAAKELAGTVEENTKISSEAANGAKTAFVEANTFNSKLTALHDQVVRISEHVERTAVSTAAAEKAAREEAVFNVRVKAAIDEKLLELNGHPPRKNKGRAKR